MGNRVRSLVLALACSAGIAAFATPASAQVVIMRKMMPFKGNAQPVVENPNAPTTPTDPDTMKYYSWVASPWHQEGICGSQGVQTRAVDCKRTDGTVVPDSRCLSNGSGPKPSMEQATIITATCSYKWEAGEWIDPGASCGNERQTREVVCRRSDGAAMDASLCAGSPPDNQQTVVDYSSCTYQWGYSAWSEPTNQCGESTQTRQVYCLRSNGQKTEDSFCSAAGEKPGAEQKAYVTIGCAANWAEGEWNKAAPACGKSTQTRDVTCMRADGVQVSEDQCILEKPVTSREVKDYSTCIDGRTPENPWGWTVGEFGAPSTTCGMATRTRSVVCTDDEGGAVPDERCLLVKPDTTSTAEETSGCSFEWKVGEFSAVVPACGNTAQTRSVVCTRTDGKSAPDASCSSPKPSSTQPYTDYSACTFGWATGEYGPWSTSCGAATQTRTVSCQRSDGTTAPEENCTKAKPSTTQSTYQTSGCTFGWQSGPWQTPQACGDVTQTRTVQCVRSDGEIIDDETCLAPYPNKPVSTQAAKDYTTCSYSWAVGSYGPWSTTCGAASSTRSVTCQRSDGVNVSDSFCSSGSEKPQSVQNSDQTSSCTYSWKSEAWGQAVPACGATVQNRTVNCVRSDTASTVVAPSFCTGTKPTTQQAATDYSSCNYNWTVSNWSSENLCGESAIQTRSVTCTRSDGGTTTDANCVTYGAGPKPASSQPVSSYSGCNYSWRVMIGAWSSTCSDSATRINNVQCLRSDGQVVDDSMCSGEVPSRQDTQGVYSSCSYTATYSTEFGECKPTTANSSTGIQTAPIVSCRRSDGTNVANSFCNPQVTSRSCVISNDQRYVREPSSLVDPYSLTQTRSAANVSQTAGEYRFAVQNTLCYDTIDKKTVAASFCASLPNGANVYDIASIPATFVPELREVYVSQNDLLAINPRGSFFSAYAAAALCARNGYGVTIRDPQGPVSYDLRCGTPDYASHYMRTPASLIDPTSAFSSSQPARWSNSDFYASSLKLAVSSTYCRDTVANQNVAAGKCSYLPTGANIYDIVSIPAVFVKELREVYVRQEDLTAAMPFGTNVLGSTIASVCSSGTNVNIGPSGGSQTWTVRCGTPDKPDRYVRSPSRLDDPGTILPSGNPSQFVNSNLSANALRLTVGGTNCRDTATGQTVAASKCAYLTTGINVYDLVSIPATFVKDLREIWVNQADVQDAIPNGNYVLGNSISTMCSSGGSLNVFPNGTSTGAQAWGVYCGQADSASNYRRDVSSIWWPTDANPAQWLNTSSSANELKILVRSTVCTDVRTNSSAAVRKCSYLNQGANIGDVLTIPATFVKDLREVYVDKEKLRALSTSTGAAFFGNTIDTACNGTSLYVGTSGNGGAYEGYRMFCGAPDNADNYVRTIAAYRDPYSYYNSADKRLINDTASGVLSMSVGGAYCLNKTTGQNVSSTKCQYLPTGPLTYDIVSAPAVWDVASKKVTINKADIKALSPLGPDSAFTSYICSGSVYAAYGATGNYQVVCQ